MFQYLRQFFAAIRLKRILLIGTLTALALLLVLVVFVAALPSILSLPAVQASLRKAAAQSLKREVAWSALAVSWTDGLILKGLVLGEGPAPLLKMTMDELTLVPEMSYRQGRWRVDLALSGRTIAAVCAPGPAKPPKPYKEPLTAIAEAVQKFQKMDWPLPLDLGVKVAVEPVDLVYTDPKSSRSLALDNLAFHFDMPSLADKPATVSLSSGLTVDGHRLEPLALHADLKRLVTAARRLRPAAALVSVRTALPGSSLTVQGGLEEPAGFSARAQVDLPRLASAFGPLARKPLPKLEGVLALNLIARVDSLQNLHADVELGGTGVAMGGGPLRRGRIGPLDLSLKQTIVSDRQKQQVRFPAGSARVGSFLEAAWEATVDRPSGKDRDLTAQLGPVRVDLQQALAAAGPLMSKSPVRELRGQLDLKQLSLQLQGRSNRGELDLTGLGVNVPRVRLALAKGEMQADGVALALDRATVPLEARKPSKVDGALTYSLQRCTLSGAQPLVAEGLKGALKLALTDLNLKSRSPRKVAANLELNQSLDLRFLDLDKKLSASGLHGELTARLRAKESGEIEGTLPGLKISAAGLQATAGEKRIGPLPLTADVAANGIRLGAAKGTPPVVERATCRINGSDFLQLAATGTLSAGTPQMVTSDGTLKVDLGRALPVAAPFLPKGAAAGGTASLAWQVAAPTVRKPLPKSRNVLARAKAAAAMIDRGELTLSLANRGINWPLKNGPLTMADLHTSQPLKVVIPGRGKGVTIGGALSFAGLSGFSGKAEKLPAQSGSFSLQGELADWQSLKLHEELRLQPFGLVQRADAVVSRLDRLVEKQEAVSATALLQQLDAALTAEIEARFPAGTTPVPGGAELSGESRAHLGLNLAAGRELQLRATASTRDFGVRLANGTVVERVNADLLLDRSYALAKGEAAGWTPLSLSLVRPAPEAIAAAGAAAIVSRVREDLRGQESGSRKFSIGRFSTVSGDTTLELTALEGDLLLGREEMGLSFFQSELLGGTVRLRSMIDLKPEVPTVATACSFTNLETYLLLPAKIRAKSARVEHDTEITGEISLDAPLQTGQRELLEGIRMNLNLRRIGANTLERALFGLDPNERNEQIVALRKQLRHGSLQVLRATTRDGAFGLDGAVKVKGIDIALPKVERLRLSELPIQKQMAKTLTGIASFRKLLDLARADTLIVGPTGKISLVRRGHD